jgi:hypothetical protein
MPARHDDRDFPDCWRIDSLVPYILGLQLHQAPIDSVIFTGIALALFGAIKGRLTGINMLKSQINNSNHVSRCCGRGRGFLFGFATWLIQKTLIRYLCVVGE